MSETMKGFAWLKEHDPARLREICSRGGRNAHRNGTAHEWTVDEARVAGRKGGVHSQRTRAAQRITTQEVQTNARHS